MADALPKRAMLVINAQSRRGAEAFDEVRDKLTAALTRIGYQVFPSQANFVLARKQGQNLKLVYEALKKKKILVRYFDVPRLQDCLRITVGASGEIQQLIEEMRRIDADPCNQSVAHAEPESEDQV